MKVSLPVLLAAAATVAAAALAASASARTNHGLGKHHLRGHGTGSIDIPANWNHFVVNGERYGIWKDARMPPSGAS